MKHERLLMMVAMGIAVAAGAADVQNFPVKPIRIYANQPGGIFDFMARIFAQGPGGPLGQPLIVDNRPGNIIPAEIVAHTDQIYFYARSSGRTASS